MARVLLAWELGAGLGHAVPLSRLARELTRAGHVVDVAVPFLDGTVAELFADSGARCLPAPFWRSAPAKETPASYAEVLLHAGYDEPAALATHLRAWRGLIELCGPRAIVFHAAPTAQLAARGLEVARLAYGDGYFIPPLTTPLPAMRHWMPTDAPRAAAAEQRALARIDTAFELAELPARGDAALADLLAVDRTFLRTFPELDHYPSRSGGEYLGPAYAVDQGEPLAWPEGSGPRVFCYVPRQAQFFPALAGCMAGLRARVIWVAPGTDEADRRPLALPHVRCIATPVRLDELRAQCELAVCHGGAGIVAAFLTAGVPLVLLPDNLERLLTTWRLRQLGVCLAPRVGPQEVELGALIEQALADTHIRAAAQDLAARYPDYDPASGERATVRAIEKALCSPVSTPAKIP